MKYLIAVFVLFLCIASISAYAGELRIAVVDLVAKEVTGATAEMVSDLLRTELLNTGKFMVVERSRMDLILKEQGFQQSGCAETECAAQIGKLLSIRKILVGTVGRLGESLIINARIIDVETGTMEYGDNAVADVEDGLAAAVSELSGKLEQRITNTKKGYSQPYRKQALVAGTIGLAGFAYGTIEYLVYADAKTKADAAYADYEAVKIRADLQGSWDKVVSARDSANSAARLSNIGYISGAVLAVVCGTLYFIHKPEAKTKTVLVVPSLDGPGVNLVLARRF